MPMVMGFLEIVGGNQPVDPGYGVPAPPLGIWGGGGVPMPTPPIVIPPPPGAPSHPIVIPPA